MTMTIADVITSPWFGVWFFSLFVTWMILSFWFRRVPAFKEKPKGTAHQVVVFAPFAFLAVQGTRMWFFDAQFTAAFKHDKIYGNYQDAQNLVLMMFAFQVWDFVTTLVTKELRAAQHLLHHGTSASLALIGLLNGPHGFLMFYAAFFFGLSEVSSVFLAAVDFFRMHKALASRFPMTNEVFRVCFAVSFLVVRCCYWPFVCVDFWTNSLHSGAPVPLLVCWYAANIGLTLLQYFWGCLIIKGIIKMAKGNKSAPEDEEPAAESREVPLAAEGGGNLLASA